MRPSFFTITLLLSIVLLTTLSEIDARPKGKKPIVHRLPTKRVSAANAKWTKPLLDRIKQLGKVPEANGRNGSLPLSIEQYLLTTYVEVGTPGQQVHLLVFIELFDELWILNPDAISCGPPVIDYDSSSSESSELGCISAFPVYNETASSSYQDENQTYRAYFNHWTYLVSDVFNLGADFQPRLQFGLANTTEQGLAEQVELSGLLALSLNGSDQLLSPLRQILNQVDERVLTISTSALDGGGMLTFGSEDTLNCPSPYVHADQLRAWTFSAHSLTIGNRTVQIQNASYSDWMYGIETSNKEVVEFFLNITGADRDTHEIECSQVEHLPVVNLNLGGEGQSVAIRPRDYIYIDENCYLTMHYSRYSDDLEFGVQFLEGRCLSANLDKKQIGFGISV